MSTPSLLAAEAPSCAERAPLTVEALRLDGEREVERIAEGIRRQVFETLRRRGIVIAMSGGVDSSVCAALAARAIGPKRVIALALPEEANSPESLRLARDWAAALGIPFEVEEIGPTLEGVGCYRRSIAAIQQVVPAYGEGWAHKIVIGSGTAGTQLNVFYLVVRDPAGEIYRHRLPPAVYLQIVAATNFKQRVRKMFEYYYADRLNYAVLGTPNLLEYDQGFFVKQGDGAADFKPIAHLYKTQVYQIGYTLGVPAEVLERTPLTETYPLEQTQEEFFFGLPYDQLDLVLYAKNHNYPPAELAAALGCTEERAAFLYRDLDSKRAAARYLHLPPLTLGTVGREIL